MEITTEHQQMILEIQQLSLTKTKYQMKKIILPVLLFGMTLLTSCDSKKNPENRTYENGYSSSSTATETSEDDEYIDNSLETGSQPYSNDNEVYGNDSQITVTTSSNSNSDVVVILKSDGEIVKNAYLNAGSSYTFNLPNGSYQVFFYGGKGWNPNKTMSNGSQGGFVANESYSKNSPVTLNYQGLSYELIPQQNGNFSTQQSDASEVF